MSAEPYATVGTPPPPRGPRGRPPSITARELSEIALRLFNELGFEETTVEDIASAAGVSRRTVFRYYASKNDIVWGDFSTQLDHFRQHLDQAPTSDPIMATVHRAIIAFNDYGEAALPELRVRMRLITTVPALQAHATVRYSEWCAVIADYVARRIGGRADDLIPATLSQASLGASIATFRVWVERGGDLLGQLDTALAAIEGGFSDATLGVERRA